MERLNGLELDLAVRAVALYLYGRQYVADGISLVHRDVDAAIAARWAKFDTEALIAEYFVYEDLKIPSG